MLPEITQALINDNSRQHTNCNRLFCCRSKGTKKVSRDGRTNICYIMFTQYQHTPLCTSIARRTINELQVGSMLTVVGALAGATPLVGAAFLGFLAAPPAFPSAGLLPLSASFLGSGLVSAVVMAPVP